MCAVFGWELWQLKHCGALFACVREPAHCSALRCKQQGGSGSTAAYERYEPGDLHPGVEGAEMTFFEFWSHPVYIPVIPDYTERVELNAGLKMSVRVHLRLGMNQRSWHVLTALNRPVRDFEGTPNSGISVFPPSGLVFVVPGAVASSFFRASSSTIPISNLV